MRRRFYCWVHPISTPSRQFPHSCNFHSNNHILCLGDIVHFRLAPCAAKRSGSFSQRIPVNGLVVRKVGSGPQRVESNSIHCGHFSRVVSHFSHSVSQTQLGHFGHAQETTRHVGKQHCALRPVTSLPSCEPSSRCSKRLIVGLDSSASDLVSVELPLVPESEACGIHIGPQLGPCLFQARQTFAEATTLCCSSRGQREKEKLDVGIVVLFFRKLSQLGVLSAVHSTDSHLCFHLQVLTFR